MVSGKKVTSKKFETPENKIMHVFDTSNFEDCDYHCIYVDSNDVIDIYILSHFYVSIINGVVMRTSTKI